MKDLLSELINKAQDIGLRNQDVKDAREYLGHNEFGLAFDTVVTQLYEYKVPINMDLYMFIELTAAKMNIKESEYVFLRELIKN